MDLDSILRMDWGGASYPDYAGYCHSGKGDAEKAAEAQNQQNNAAGQKFQNTAQKTYSQYEGDPTQTAYYKRNLGIAQDSTAQAYNQARGANRTAARMAGFGYNQPISGADDKTINLMEGRDMAQLPRTVAGQTAELGLQAANQTAGMGSSDLGVASNNLNTWSTAENQRKQRQMQMWSSIAGDVTGMFAPIKIPGTSTGAGANG